LGRTCAQRPPVFIFPPPPSPPSAPMFCPREAPLMGHPPANVWGGKKMGGGGARKTNGAGGGDKTLGCLVGGGAVGGGGGGLGRPFETLGFEQLG